MPEQVVDYSDRHVIGKVERVRGRQIQDVDMARLMDTIRIYASRFKNRTQGFPRNWIAGDFVLIEPTGIELDLFPLTFFCKDCGKASRFASVHELDRSIARNNYRCPKCRTGELEQADIVHFCTCGKLETLVVPKCPDHGTSSMILQKFGSSSIKRWIWQCNHPDHGRNPKDVSRVGAHCFSHSPSKFMSHGPFSSSGVYYPESVVLVNVPPLVKKGEIGEDLWRVVIAEYLGLTHFGAAREIAESGGRSRSTMSVAEIRRTLIEEDHIPAAHVDRMIRRMAVPTGTADVRELAEAVKRILPVHSDALAKIASEIFSYTQIVGGEGSESLQKVVSRTHGPFSERIRLAPAKLSEMGFSDAFVTTDFPLVRATFGYSRGDPERSKSTLRAFPRNPDFSGHTPIYGASIQTEAIVLRLDQVKVLNWLIANGWLPVPPANDPVSINAWFLQHVKLDAIPPYGLIPGEETVTKWVYRLVHSLSHLLLRHTSAIAGIDRDSLGEFLFPSVPAFAIFANNSQEFQLGGLYTLFENSILPWFEVASQEVRYCLNDPICIRSESSCHACLFLSEVSCEHFNRELGRDVIIGSVESGSGPKVGYWSEVE